MKILTVNYIDGEVRFIIEGVTGTSLSIENKIPKKTEHPKVFCIKLTAVSTVNSVKNELKAMLALEQPDNTEQAFNDLNLKGLEGSDI